MRTPLFPYGHTLRLSRQRADLIKHRTMSGVEGLLVFVVTFVIATLIVVGIFWLIAALISLLHVVPPVL